MEKTIEQMDLRGLIDGVVATIRRAGASVNWTPNVKPVICAIRPHTLERIISNLLDNARRYGNNENIELECLHEKKQVRIRILDQGPGIPASEREAVFCPSHRLETACSVTGGGSGLELAFARQLAEANDWELSLGARSNGGTIAQIMLSCQSQ